MQTDTTELAELTLPPSCGFPRQLHIRRDPNGYARVSMWPPNAHVPLAHGHGAQNECHIMQSRICTDRDVLTVGSAHFWITKSESKQLVERFGFRVQS